MKRRCCRVRDPAWVFLPAPQNAISATAIREAAGKKEPYHSQAAQTAASPARHQPAPRKTRREAGAGGGSGVAGLPAQEDHRRRSEEGAAPRAAKAKTEPSRAGPMQKLIVTSLEDDKAENVVTLDLTGKAMFCDRMVIASGLADRQITAMAQHLREKLHDGRPEARADRGSGRLRLGADRCRRHRRASVQAGGADDVRAGEDVGRGPGRGGLIPITVRADR